MRRPIPESYWVRPGALLAGEYPGARDDALARRKLRRLLGAGVSAFLDLTEPGEYGLRAYLPLLQAEAAALGHNITYRRMPIPDMGLPTAPVMAQTLAAIDLALREGRVLYVHCWGGIGRTGTVIGCYLVRHGMSGEEALRAIARLRAATPDAARPSPETEAQRRFVLSWREGQ